MTFEEILEALRQADTRVRMAQYILHLPNSIAYSAMCSKLDLLPDLPVGQDVATAFPELTRNPSAVVAELSLASYQGLLEKGAAAKMLQQTPFFPEGVMNRMFLTLLLMIVLEEQIETAKGAYTIGSLY